LVQRVVVFFCITTQLAIARTPSANTLALPRSTSAFSAMLVMPASAAVSGILTCGAPAPNRRSISALNCSELSRQIRCAMRGSPGSVPTGAPPGPVPGKPPGPPPGAGTKGSPPPGALLRAISPEHPPSASPAAVASVQIASAVPQDGSVRAGIAQRWLIEVLLLTGYAAERMTVRACPYDQCASRGLRTFPP
jgi:hypothetical protein